MFAFSGCSSLTEVYCYAEEVPKADSYFDNVNVADATLYVPRAAIDAYKAAYPWRGFGTIKAIEDVTGVKNISANGDGTADKTKGTADGKFIKDGKLVIIKGGKEYNAFGAVKK